MVGRVILNAPCLGGLRTIRPTMVGRVILNAPCLFFCRNFNIRACLPPIRFGMLLTNLQAKSRHGGRKRRNVQWKT